MVAVDQVAGLVGNDVLHGGDGSLDLAITAKIDFY